MYLLLHVFNRKVNNIDNNITLYLSISLVELNFAKKKYTDFVQLKLYVYTFNFIKYNTADCGHEQRIRRHNFANCNKISQI